MNASASSSRSGNEPLVVVALSGGVDSSVAAALLLEQGFRVHAVTLQLVACRDAPDARSCCGTDGMIAARQVARTLGVTHEVLDCRAVFEREVLRPAWAEYAAGRTPSPCIHCNERLKFGLLLEHARTLGARAVASGHFARLTVDPADGRPVLHRGRDRRKDQSYFLFALDDARLGQLSFPLGELTKDEVRDRARALGLASAERRESTDACFQVDGEGFAESLRRLVGAPTCPGRVVDVAGREVGRHDGFHRFTVGQRRGVGVAAGRRVWVQSLEPVTAAVVVTADEATLGSGALLLHGVRWTGRPAGWRPADTLHVEAQIRYRARPAEAQVDLAPDGRAIVRFDAPQRAVAPGQAVVFYDRDAVVGGGWIVSRLA